MVIIMICKFEAHEHLLIAKVWDGSPVHKNVSTRTWDRLNKDNVFDAENEFYYIVWSNMRQNNWDLVARHSQRIIFLEHDEYYDL